MKNRDVIERTIDAANHYDCPVGDHVYFLGQYFGSLRFFSCKESALAYPYCLGDEHILVARTSYDEKLAKKFLESFLSLCKLYDLEPDKDFTYEAFSRVDAHRKTQTSYYIQIDGWFNQNILTREVWRFFCRTIKEGGYCSLWSIEDFSTGHYLYEYYEDEYSKETTKIFEKVIKNLRAICDIVDVPYLEKQVYKGLLNWTAGNDFKKALDSLQK